MLGYPLRFNSAVAARRCVKALLSTCLALGSSVCLYAQASVEQLPQQAERFEHIRTLHIAHQGQLLVASGLNGGDPNAATNIKSASKLLMSAMVGIAIDKHLIPSVDTPVSQLLPDQLPKNPSAELAKVTVGHLLSMQAGLQRTSGEYYGRWVNSDNWVKYVLSRPFDEKPGGKMLYSTGNTHVLSAIVMKQSGRSTYQQFNRWFAPAGIRVDSWITDPQGIPMGGNQVSMTPADLLEFGEVYRRGGVAQNGQRLISKDWIQQSWTPRTQSFYTDDDHGYGWFRRDLAVYESWYGWGYGGQMLYVVPKLALTVVITSDTSNPSGRNGYARQLHQFVADEVIPAVKGI